MIYIGIEPAVQTWPIKNNVQQFSGSHGTQRTEQYTDMVDTDSIIPIHKGKRLEVSPSAFSLRSQCLPGKERNKLVRRAEVFTLLWNLTSLEQIKFRASKIITSILIYISNRMQRYTVYFIWKLLYMFRVVSSTNIRSANNRIYSIWYLSDRYCYLPL